MSIKETPARVAAGRGKSNANRSASRTKKPAKPQAQPTARMRLDLIRTDGGTQLRDAVSPATVAEYTEALLAGAKFPPIVVFFDGTDHWLADGFHRLDAYRQAELEEIEAEVRDGSRRDAMLHAAGANADHGLRRTGEDKKRAVLALLRDPEWRQWSDREIATKAKVDHKTVGRYRRELNGEIPIDTERRFTTRHGTETTRTVPTHTEAKTDNLRGKFLAELPTELLVEECRRRGLEVTEQ